jgi:hypothetical protein
MHVMVDGLGMSEEFITEEEEAALLEFVASEERLWIETLSRRVQHYGYARAWPAATLQIALHACARHAHTE